MIIGKERYDGYCIFCDECPLAKEQIKQRVNRISKFDNDEYCQPEYCCCDKIGDDIFDVNGFCEDGLVKQNNKNIKKDNPRKTGREYRRAMTDKKNKRKYAIAVNHWIPLGGYVEWNFVGDKMVPVGKYVKYKSNSNAQRYLKHRNNRAVRNCNHLPSEKGGYKKVSEYFWDLY